MLCHGAAYRRQPPYSLAVSSHLLQLLVFCIERRESPLRQVIKKAAIKVQVYLMGHPWGRKWQHASVLLLEESHGQRSQTGYTQDGRVLDSKTDDI